MYEFGSPKGLDCGIGCISGIGGTCGTLGFFFVHTVDCSRHVSQGSRGAGRIQPPKERESSLLRSPYSKGPDIVS